LDPFSSLSFYLDFCSEYSGIVTGFAPLLHSGSLTHSYPANTQKLIRFCRENQPREKAIMAKRIPAPRVISAEEALRTEIILNQALIDILIAKGFISEQELIRGIRKIKREREILAENWDCPS